MDRAGQAEGEKRVMELLIEPLLRRGLARPLKATIAQFEDQKRELCKKLAYMTPMNLMALEESTAKHAVGKDRDRLPVANWILEEAAKCQEPEAGTSNLVLAVFNHELGRAAVREGWAPELLAHLRDQWRWPGQYAVSKIKEAARPAIRRLEDLSRYADEELAPDERRWLVDRRAKLNRCAELVAQAETGA